MSTREAVRAAIERFVRKTTGEHVNADDVAEEVVDLVAAVAARDDVERRGARGGAEGDGEMREKPFFTTGECPDMDFSNVAPSRPIGRGDLEQKVESYRLASAIDRAIAGLAITLDHAGLPSETTVALICHRIYAATGAKVETRRDGGSLEILVWGQPVPNAYGRPRGLRLTWHGTSCTCAFGVEEFED